MTFQATQYILCCLGGLCTGLHCTALHSGWLCSADIVSRDVFSTEYRVHILLAFTDSLFFNIFLLAKRQITAFSIYLGPARISRFSLGTIVGHCTLQKLQTLSAKSEGKDLNFSGLVSLGTSRSLLLPSFR